MLNTIDSNFQDPKYIITLVVLPTPYVGFWDHFWHVLDFFFFFFRLNSFLTFHLLTDFYDFFFILFRFQFLKNCPCRFMNFCLIYLLFGDIWQLIFQKHDFYPQETDFSILRENEAKIKKCTLTIFSKLKSEEKKYNHQNQSKIKSEKRF
ncbi:unnamed protein product [Meganyctiphanes norvegica]|uniref:Uncharacterized protein n=1 Tax=Meganyctiphanes norvegica TaxID=48144 RepID=A0AAV2QST1_MEGNR